MHLTIDKDKEIKRKKGDKIKMKKSALFAFIIVLTAFSAISCGNEPDSDSSVTIDLPGVTTESESESEPETESDSDSETTTDTESTSEQTTSGKSTKTTAVSTEIRTKTTKEVATEKVTEPEQQQEVTEAPPVETPEPPVDEQPQTEPPATEPPVVQQVQFSIDNLDNSAVDIVTALGDAVDVQNATGCLANGADQRIYIYDGLQISCYMNGDTPYIYEIDITNSNYSTSGGITVGSMRADVESVYGTGEESGNYVIYYSDNKELDIEYDGDNVKSIIFYMNL